MRLLILSFYFTPDLSAGSFRMQALVDALMAADADLKIDLVTTMPNRYQRLAAQALEHEDLDRLSIRRIELPVHNSGMFDQARAFLHFARRARAITATGQWDAVFATSSRLMTGVLAANIARRKKTPLYLDIRDLFTDTIKDVLAGSPLRVLGPVFNGLERKMLNQAKRVNVVSPGFVPHVSAIAPHLDIRTFTNGIDSEFLTPQVETETIKDTNDGEVVILYAGNIGEGQGLHKIIPEVASRTIGSTRFRIIGDGGRRKHLEDAISARNIPNVDLLPPMPRKELLKHYAAADILFLQLNDYEAFLKVLPSKIFEYAATGKPMLAGVGGFAAKFLNEEVGGVEVFQPCDVSAMCGALKRIDTRKILRRGRFLKKYARQSIMRQMAADIIEFTKGN